MNLTICNSFNLGKFWKLLRPTLTKERWINPVYFSNVSLCSSVNVPSGKEISSSRIISSIYFNEIIINKIYFFWIMFS